ncbi:MAG: pantoate--beta-alanine ligase [Melioribacteraceae bacterium]|nr:pantoate--beta-alanine ligase [Melioribacteraceae bacterium]MCF8353706.1 pantoate--beta-alanine ligase [Melioribacteraceae bacterium]MCF8394959.1 pantoate--beta-alanine ligase [Melioribacteraceae bacterium]MCF8418622.1 pantoate--beta-alanine ligase [Melioribacteraceae bacterium]
MIQIIKNVPEWKSLLKNDLKETTIGFVPTMGALHEGHLSLVERSVLENRITVFSIFINPTQFNDKSDLQNYPKTFDKDLELLKSRNVDFIFYPGYEEIYNDNYNYKVIENNLSGKLCGKHRPGHFDGVLTVVMKLLNIIEADNAYFGEKDYQQYLLIKGMAEAFFIKTEIIPCQTIRAADGLAHSSRNEMLTPEERKIAVKFPELLKSDFPIEEIKSELNYAGFKVDYIEDMNGRRFGAVHLGRVRLIDNVKK